MPRAYVNGLRRRGLSPRRACVPQERAVVLESPSQEMASEDKLARARESFRRRAWAEAHAGFAAQDRSAPLERDDLERLAEAAFLIGNDVESAAVWARAHDRSLRSNDPARAARCAFRVAFQHLNVGEVAQGLGWLSRAQRLLEEKQLDCVERGYLLLPAAVRAVDEGRYDAAYAAFSAAAGIAGRFQNAELATMAEYGRGRALIGSGRTAEGVALIDEAMVAVATGAVSPSVVGALYCSAIEAWRSILDMRRAQEWTAALGRWCASQPDLVPFRGQCLVYRAEIMELHGEWADAMDEVLRACERLTHPPEHPAAAQAFYQQAELHRLRGEFAKAEDAYRQASKRGRIPQPGLAQLRVAQGHVSTAAAAMRRIVDETKDPVSRATMLPAYVEVLLAEGDIPGARAAAVELATIAAERDAPLLRAVAAQALGAVLLSERDPSGAIARLRDAWAGWQVLESPYGAARVRVLLGVAYRALDDHDSADMEFDAARSTFQQLGAATDLHRLQQVWRPSTSQRTHDMLTPREIEVLALLATGMTNRAIAADLVISEKTVARHVSNIFEKLEVSSRAAATAYAFKHKLV